jgi:hypothetical protein
MSEAATAWANAQLGVRFKGGLGDKSPPAVLLRDFARTSGSIQGSGEALGGGGSCVTLPAR